MGLQSAINSTIGTIGSAIKGYKELTAQQSIATSQQSVAAAAASQSMRNEVAAKTAQRRNFMEYLGKQPTSFGGTVSQLPISVQKQLAAQYSKNDRRKLMDKMDKEALNGKHRSSNSNTKL